MLKWILGILAIALLMKRSSTPNSTTTALAAPPEGNISSWANSGSRSVSPVDAGSFYVDGSGTKTVSSQRVPVPPIRLVPTIENFGTRNFYNSTGRYSIPGRN